MWLSNEMTMIPLISWWRSDNEHKICIYLEIKTFPNDSRARRFCVANMSFLSCFAALSQT